MSKKYLSKIIHGSTVIETVSAIDIMTEQLALDLFNLIFDDSIYEVNE